MGGFNVKLPEGAGAGAARSNGYVVAHDTPSLVDQRGRAVTIRDVMLHHLVFHRRRAAAVAARAPSRSGEAFYGTGEEKQDLRLPARLRLPDRARPTSGAITAMLMSHSMRADRRLHPLPGHGRDRPAADARRTPFWVRANGCGAAGQLPGLRRRRARVDRTCAATTGRAPFNGRIVAVGGHLHGGAKDMWLSQPRCGDRRLLDTRPLFGMPDHLYYRARPILHEPGPIDTRYFLSKTGIAVRKGEKIRLTGTYDAERPHPRVMSIMHVYLARDTRPSRRAARRCRPTPLPRRSPSRVRLEPPVVKVPLNGINADGHTSRSSTPPWPRAPLTSGAVGGPARQPVHPAPHLAAGRLRS